VLFVEKATPVENSASRANSDSGTSCTRISGGCGGGLGSGGLLLRGRIDGGVSLSLNDAVCMIFTSDIWEYFSTISSFRISFKHQIEW